MVSGEDEEEEERELLSQLVNDKLTVASGSETDCGQAFCLNACDGSLTIVTLAVVQRRLSLLRGHSRRR
jgi:hypothetical protein